MGYEASCCPCCESAALDVRAALVSPFVADYVLATAPELCRLMACRACEAVFFARRFSAGEIDRLYGDYRGEGYFAARHCAEPWYTRRFNDDLGDADEIARRRGVYRRTLAPFAGEVASVLDYAGDSGQLMPGGPGRDLYVYDISGVEPVAGVARIAEAQALAGRTFDLVLLCHVVEHFSEPLRETAEVVRHVRPGGLLYVEVPFERFPITDIPRAGWYRRYLNAIRRSPALLKLADFWSTAIRVKFGRIAPLAFVKLHEHLTYFDPASLRRLLERTGMEVLSCEVAPEMKAVVALCRRPAAA